MTFEEWWEKEFPNYKEHSATKDVAEAAWEAAVTNMIKLEQDLESAYEDLAGEDI